MSPLLYLQENICWMDQILDLTWEDMDELYIFMKELRKLEVFEMVIYFLLW